MDPDIHAGPGGPPQHPPAEEWRLTLFVAGQSPKSLMAYANLRRICEDHLPGRHEIRIVDLAKEPALAKHFQIVAVPTLIRETPAPVKRIIGSLSDVGRLLEKLDLSTHPTP